MESVGAQSDPLYSFKHNLNILLFGEYKHNCKYLWVRYRKVLQRKSADFVFSVHDKEFLQYNIDKKVQNLVEKSNLWSLKISEYCLENSKLLIFLNRVHTFKTVINKICEEKINYGKTFCFEKNIYMLQSTFNFNDPKMDMTTLRLKYLTSCLKNILLCTGFKLVDSVKECDLQLELSSKSNRKAEDCNVRILCAAVINSDNSAKDIKLSAEDYIKKRNDDLKKLCSEKYEYMDMPVCSSMLESLTDASVKFDLLQIKASQVVNLNSTIVSPENQEQNFKGSVFILYNYARISSIFEKYEKLVLADIYPPLISINDVDFSLLSTEEEWQLVFRFLLTFPSMLQECLMQISEGKVNIHELCSYLIGLSGLFSLFYRKTKVLTQTVEHLLPETFARLYLLKAVQTVMLNGLSLMEITPIRQM